MPDSPLDAHVATPQDLKERIAAERRGTPFLVYRDVDNKQKIVDLVPTGERVTVGRRPSNNSTGAQASRKLPRRPGG